MRLGSQLILARGGEAEADGNELLWQPPPTRIAPKEKRLPRSLDKEAAVSFGDRELTVLVTTMAREQRSAVLGRSSKQVSARAC